MHHHHYYYPAAPQMKTNPEVQRHFFHQQVCPGLQSLHAPVVVQETPVIFHTEKVDKTEHLKATRIGRLTVEERLQKVRRYIAKRN